MAKVLYVTGFCSAGLHEGTRPKGVSGRGLKTCGFIDECGCKCHSDLTKMHDMTGTPRVVHMNPDYKVPISRFVMPHLEDVISIQQNAAPEEEPPAPRNPLEVTSAKFNETPTGIRARGQLETEVLLVCSSFMRGELPFEDLTPKIIASEIDKFDPPSVGAIGAVLDRWASIGFAKRDKSPVRFISFTVDGMLYGLDHMKSKAKREAKLKQGAAARTLRRR